MSNSTHEQIGDNANETAVEEESTKAEIEREERVQNYYVSHRMFGVLLSLNYITTETVG